MKLTDLKIALVAKAKDELTTQMEGLARYVDEIAASRNDQTKSSAGDKHETSRALAQAELDRASVQLSKARSLRASFGQMDFEKTHEVVQAGCLVETQDGLFLLAAAVGKVTVHKSTCHVISPASPLGQSLLDKRKGDSFTFQSRQITILGLA